MNTSTLEMQCPTAEKVAVSDEWLIVGLSDGRVLSVPLVWYPRLLNGSRAERNRWRLIGKGIGIHWPALDEDLSIEGLLRGTKTGESRESFSKWMATRRTARRVKKGPGRQVMPIGYVSPTVSRSVRRVAEQAGVYGIDNKGRRKENGV